jgi:hypothetical protein
MDVAELYCALLTNASVIDRLELCWALLCLFSAELIMNTLSSLTPFSYYMWFSVVKHWDEVFRVDLLDILALMNLDGLWVGII